MQPDPATLKISNTAEIGCSPSKAELHGEGEELQTLCGLPSGRYFTLLLKIKLPEQFLQLCQLETILLLSNLHHPALIKKQSR